MFHLNLEALLKIMMCDSLSCSAVWMLCTTHHACSTHLFVEPSSNHSVYWLVLYLFQTVCLSFKCSWLWICKNCRGKTNIYCLKNHFQDYQNQMKMAFMLAYWRLNSLVPCWGNNDNRNKHYSKLS